jgi:hypothetical protein
MLEVISGIITRKVGVFQNIGEGPLFENAMLRDYKTLSIGGLKNNMGPFLMVHSPSEGLKNLDAAFSGGDAPSGFNFHVGNEGLGRVI